MKRCRMRGAARFSSSIYHVCTRARPVHLLLFLVCIPSRTRLLYHRARPATMQTRNFFKYFFCCLSHVELFDVARNVTTPPPTSRILKIAFDLVKKKTMRVATRYAIICRKVTRKSLNITKSP